MHPSPPTRVPVAAEAGRPIVSTPNETGLPAPLNYASFITATPWPSKANARRQQPDFGQACHQTAVIRDRIGRRRLDGGPAARSEVPLSSLRGLAAERQVSPCIRARRSA